jgi:2-hydroxy-3-keto-5-methylthiopentenyl-1-phosphate phosphatase
MLSAVFGLWHKGPRMEVKFIESNLSLSGKTNYLKFVVDHMSKQQKLIELSVYSDKQRIHRIDSYALRLRIADNKLKTSSIKKLHELMEAYEFGDDGISELEKAIKDYIEKKGFVPWETRVKNYIDKYKVSGEQLSDLIELIK